MTFCGLLPHLVVVLEVFFPFTKVFQIDHNVLKLAVGSVTLKGAL